MDHRDFLVEIIAEHQLARDSGFCVAKDCKFIASKVTDPNSRDFKRGWSTNIQSMRREYGRHIADLFFGKEV
jgi:hypothetical protein